MNKFGKAELDNMDKRYRAKFINSLSGAKSVNLVGTINNLKQTNLSIVSSCVHLGANPSLMGIVFRPRSVPRNTIDNIINQKKFTLNHVHDAIVKQAHQTSARYPEEISEFSAVGLTEHYEENNPAPFVKESFLRISMSLEEVIPIKQNGTDFLIARIDTVYVDTKHVDEDGHIRLSELNTVSVTGLDNYHTLNEIFRLSYAKPDKELTTI